MNAAMKTLVQGFRDSAIDVLKADPHPDHAEIVRIACLWIKQQDVLEAKAAAIAKAQAARAARNAPAPQPEA